MYHGFATLSCGPCAKRIPYLVYTRGDYLSPITHLQAVVEDDKLELVAL